MQDTNNNLVHFLFSCWGHITYKIETPVFCGHVYFGWWVNCKHRVKWVKPILTLYTCPLNKRLNVVNPVNKASSHLIAQCDYSYQITLLTVSTSYCLFYWCGFILHLGGQTIGPKTIRGRMNGTQLLLPKWHYQLLCCRFVIGHIWHVYKLPRCNFSLNIIP